MIRIKGCPKCEGDTALERDSYGWYEQCLQCGYMRDLMPEVTSKKYSTRAEGMGVVKIE